MPGDTLRGPKTGGRDADATGEPHVFLVLECQRPRSGSLRAALGDVDEVIFVRGTRAATRENVGGARRLTLAVPDPLMSARHARLGRIDGSWVLDDLGSTNGTRIGGQRVERVKLDDRAVFQLGETLFIHREDMPTPKGTAPVLDKTVATPGIATLVPAYERALFEVGRVAISNVPLLLLGETGSGKEVLARLAHDVSQRGGAFVAVNCAAMPEALVEGQLFGHVKGFVTGAVRDELGFVRASDKGTLFLDEIGDMPKISQAALLRVLQEREVTPVGGTKPVKVDLRVVAATHQPIEILTAGTGSIRPDLHARLAGFTHELLPLRERKEDIGLLVKSLLARHAEGRDVRISAELGRALLSYDWPFNVRELEQALSVAVVLSADTVELEHLPEGMRRAMTSRREPPLSEEDLRERLVTALKAHAGNVTDVSRAMGRTRMQVHRWMKRWGIDPAIFRK